MELCFHLSVCFSFKTDSVILFRYIMFKKKEIENIFKIFKHEIQETIPNVGTKCGVRLFYRNNFCVPNSFWELYSKYFLNAYFNHPNTFYFEFITRHCFTVFFFFFNTYV